MKKRIFVCILIFTTCLFYLLIPNIVFGQSTIVFNRYKETFRHPDVHAFLPPVLLEFKDPVSPAFLSPVLISRFVENPRYILNFYKKTDDSILILLLLDDQFGKLFRDEQFHAMVWSPTEVDKLVGLIRALKPRAREDCKVLPPVPTTLLIVSGYGQDGAPSTRLSRPFVVEVKDQYGNAFSGTNVVFRVREGGGSLSATTAPINNGQAQTYLTLGSSAGANVVKASVSDISLPQIFTATAVASDEPRKAATLSIVSGYGQEGEPGTRLDDPFVVEVRDQYGDPFSSVNVVFSATQGDGRVSSTMDRTNSAGRAETTLTLGSSAGANWVEASVTDIAQSQTFTAIAIAPTPDPSAEPDPVVSTQLPPVYWIEDGALYYRPTVGEKRMLWEPSEGTLTGGLAVDMETRRIYWTEKIGNQMGMGRIQSADLEGENIREIKKIARVPHGVTVDTETGNVYWTTSGGKIQRINVKVSESDIKTSNFDPNFLTGLNSPKHIAFDETTRRLYWTEADGIWNIYPGGKAKMKRPLNTGPLDELRGIAVADDTVYWTEKTIDGQGKVKSMNRNGSGIKLHAVLAVVPEGIAVDPTGGRAYWTTSRGGIESTPLIGVIKTGVEDAGIRATGIALGRLSSVPLIAAAPSVSSVGSVENALLANYPNPFNPETWIPYQLSEAADVTVSIYSVNGALVRTLALGHQSAGTYRSRSRAAYWDGRNDFGERVASGLYFYTLTAGDFTATRKMLIRK